MPWLSTFVKPFSLTASPTILLTQTPPRLTLRLDQWIQNHQLLGTVVDTQLAYRMDYQDAIPLGMSVVEYNPQGRAAQEVHGATKLVAEQAGDGLMNKRVDPRAALDASTRQLRQALRNDVGKRASDEMRTTFSV